jgi:hypothetical protein
MKVVYVFLLFFVGMATKAQYTPLYPYFFEDQCRGAERVNDGIVFMHHVGEYPEWGSTLKPSDVLGAFTGLYKYDFEGVYQAKYLFPDNDSTFHYGMFSRKMNDGTIVVAGEVWRNVTGNRSYDPFIALINSADMSLNQIYYYPVVENSDRYIDGLAVSDYNHLGVLSGSRLRVFDEQVDIQLTYSNASCNVQSSVYDNTRLHFNNHFYRLMYANNSRTTLLKYINGVNACEVVYSQNQVNNFPGMITGSFLHYSDRGIRLNENNFIVNAKASSNIAFVAKIDTQEMVSVFYLDSTVYENNIDHGFSGIDFVHTSHVYFAYSTRVDGVHGTLLYCINESGELNWKQFYPLNEELETSRYMGMHQVVATPDKGCVVLYGVNGYNNKSDVFVLRVDSLGGVKSFITDVKEQKLNVSSFILYPNPARNTVNFVAENQQDFEVQLYDLQGRKVLSKKAFNTSALEVNVEALASGVYYYQLLNQQGEAMQQGKVVKE